MLGPHRIGSADDGAIHKGFDEGQTKGYSQAPSSPPAHPTPAAALSCYCHITALHVTFLQNDAAQFSGLWRSRAAGGGGASHHKPHNRRRDKGATEGQRADSADVAEEGLHLQREPGLEHDRWQQRNEEEVSLEHSQSFVSLPLLLNYPMRSM